MDFRKVDNFEDFENLVRAYIDGNETLKNRIREEAAKLQNHNA